MLIEHFKEDCVEAIYSRLEQNGRMLPKGLHFLNSWVNRSENICFQWMQTDNPELLRIWMNQWNDLVDFEIFQVQSTRSI